MTRILALAASVLALALPAMAIAQPGAKLRQTVAYGDLDLQSRAGMATLKRRMHSAAANICRQAARDAGEATSSNAYSRCIARAMDHAMRRLQDQTGAKTIDVEAAGGEVAAR